nr:immunoglobulin light chain junction region [Macaca mulatta]
FQHHNTHPWTF